MEIILLERIGRLGSLGDKVAVKAGFARNFLIPQGKAVPATKPNIAKFETRRAELEKVAAENLQVAQARADVLAGLATITISGRAADEGKLYGSVGTHEIVEAIKKAGVELNKSEVSLPNGAIRELGEYEIQIQLHSDVSAIIKLNIVAEA